MTPITLARNLLIAAFLLSMAACSSSDSDDSNRQDADGADNSTEQELPATPGTVDDPLINDPTQSPDASGEESNPEENSEPDSSTNTDGDSSPEDVANPSEDTDEESTEDTSGESTGVQSTDLLIPPTTPGSDLDRLVQGLTRQASATLLDLNSRISQGEELTEQQEKCIGSYEEGFGEPLLAVNCDPKLATGDTELWVGEAAFYNTEACREALFDKSSETCVLERISLLISADWQIPEGGGRPTLAFPGAELAYAIDDTMLRINNTEEKPENLFSCDISLDTLAISSPLNVTNCDSTVKSMADEIDRLQGF